MVDRLNATASARDRRADILAAALQEFGRFGFSGARIERIAATASVNKQLLFHYFDSKDGLLGAALDPLLAECATSRSPHGTPLERIKRQVAALEAVARSRPGLLSLLADAEANPEFPAGPATRLMAWRNEWLGLVRSALVEGQRSGFVRDDLDPGAISLTAFAAAIGRSVAGGELDLGRLLAEHCAWR